MIVVLLLNLGLFSLIGFLCLHFNSLLPCLLILAAFRYESKPSEKEPETGVEEENR